MSESILARHPGRCPECDEPIFVDDLIREWKGDWLHDDCLDSDLIALHDPEAWRAVAAELGVPADLDWDDIVRRFTEKFCVGTKCWEWTGAKNGHGYGNFNIGKKWMPAHRAALIVVSGGIPSDRFACHRCDNRPCIRPSHLFAGTAKDNTADMHAKGRAGVFDRRGNANGRSRLTEPQVREIRRRRGMRATELGAEFGVSPSAIRAIWTGQNWGWLPDEEPGS